MIFLRRLAYFVLAVIMLTAAWTAIANASCADMQAIAQRCANEMARNNRLDHCGSMGQRAENIALASSRNGAMHLWRISKTGHAEIMQLPGCKAVANKGRYWALEVGW